MKKLCILVIMSNAILAASAQKGGTHTEFGVKGGLNIANVSVENTTNPDSKVSFYLGGLAHIHLDKQFALQPELFFSGQGYKQTQSGTDYKTSLNYINLPVLGQFMFGEGFRIETGPQAGVLVSAKTKVNGNSVDVKDNIKTFDFSWVFGAGYLTESGFGVDARYNLGISDINDVSSDKVSNRVFAVGVFYQFKK